MCCTCGSTVPGLGRSRDTLTLATLEQRLERLRDCQAMPDSILGIVCETVLPELYGSPPLSKRGTAALPGSHYRRKRYTERVARGQQVFSPKDR